MTLIKEQTFSKALCCSRKCALLLFYNLLACAVYAQENYEIQVYASPTMPKHSAIFELHSNYTFSGEKKTVNKVRPTHHALHETIEITAGIANNFELGVYLFMNQASGYGYQVVGTHIRPRITAPLKWKLPVGLSLSAEIGTQKATYSEETWNMEIRPVIDKQWSKFYASLNPVLGISLKGISDKHTPVFEPSLKTSYQFFKTASFGFEYYGGMGNINNFESTSNQGHALYFVYDLTGFPKWELNIGLGFGLTQATDKFNAKLLFGRRINWGQKK